jgi:hypothetical protein
MITKSHASLLNQSAMIPGLVYGGQNLSYPLTNIVNLMLLDEVMEILINQWLKRIAKVWIMISRVLVTTIKEEREPVPKDATSGQIDLSQEEEKDTSFLKTFPVKPKPNPNNSSTMTSTTLPINT